VAACEPGAESAIGKRPENALDALLDELQTFAKPPASAPQAIPGAGAAGAHHPSMAEIGRRKGSIEAPAPPPNPGGSLRRLHSYPSSSDGGGNSPPNIARLQLEGKPPITSPKPPVPERNADLIGKRVPPPPPPRTSSRSPLASPTSPSLPPRAPSQPIMGTHGGTLRRSAAARAVPREGADPSAPAAATGTSAPTAAPVSNSSSCESVNSQEGAANAASKKVRQEALEQRHQELLRKQRALQEQYARLQQLQRGGAGLAAIPPPDLLLKKTGSESNLLAKMGIGQGLSAAAPISGSLTHLASTGSANPAPTSNSTNAGTAPSTTNKIYETDIL